MGPFKLEHFAEQINLRDKKHLILLAVILVYLAIPAIILLLIHLKISQIKLY